MELTWRDGAATLLVAAAAIVTLSVTSGWGWPLLADPRAGGIAVFVLGFAASVAGGGPYWFLAALRPGGVSRLGMTFTMGASVMGLAILGLLATNVFLNSIPLLVGATCALMALWIIATGHHMVEPMPERSRRGLTSIVQ